MQKYAFVMHLKEGEEAEYKRRHDAIWPELVSDIHKAGFVNFSIWRDGVTLFAYYEAEDRDAAWTKLAQSEVNAKWGEWFAPILDVEVESETGLARHLALIWSLEPQAEDGGA